MNIFIDTDFLYALNDKSDSLHKKAIKIINKFNDQKVSLFTSTNVLLETLTLLSQRISKKTAIRILLELRSGAYEVVHPSEEIVLKAEKIFIDIASKNVSYADCLSMAVMKECEIKHIFSFDIHFKKQGFKRIEID